MRSLKVFVGLLLFIATAACSTHPRKIECEAHLVPINPPAPVAKVSAEVQP
jgi:hypothetical protein